MDYGYEKILNVQRRCGVSFEIADKALRYSKGDIDKACIYALRKSSQQKSKFSKFMSALANFITYRFIISKDDDAVINIPTGIVILFSFVIMIITNGFSGFAFLCFFLLGIIIMTGFTMSITPKVELEQKVQKINNQVMQEEEVFEQYSEDEVEDEDGYNTIEIE